MRKDVEVCRGGNGTKTSTIYQRVFLSFTVSQNWNFEIRSLFFFKSFMCLVILMFCVTWWRFFLDLVEQIIIFVRNGSPLSRNLKTIVVSSKCRWLNGFPARGMWCMAGCGSAGEQKETRPSIFVLDSWAHSSASENAGRRLCKHLPRNNTLRNKKEHD